MWGVLVRVCGSGQDAAMGDGTPENSRRKRDPRDEYEPPRRGWKRALLWSAGLAFAMGAFFGGRFLLPPSGTNFSQRAGFAVYFRDNPRADTPAAGADLALLEKFRPRLNVAPEAEGPIDFYGDYIARGVLRDGAGNVLASKVDRATLNKYRGEPSVVFTHALGAGKGVGQAKGGAVVFGRAARDVIPGHGPMTFLTYHFVFRTSGLPAARNGVLGALAGLAGDTRDWHQLDHYTQATVVLDRAGKPVALFLQQHNYGRSWLFGRDLKLPEDGRARLMAAVSSNELYPYEGGETRHRAVRFFSPEAARYLVFGTDKPWISADDITRPGREAAYRLAPLAPADAFYSFQGFLGERRRLPGRDGPPGADYDTWPRHKGPARQLLLFSWRPCDGPQLDRIIRAMDLPPSAGKTGARLDSPEMRALADAFFDRTRTAPRC